MVLLTNKHNEGNKMTKLQEMKINKIQRNVISYCSAPVYTTAKLNFEDMNSGCVLFSVTNPDAPWYEGRLETFGYITPKGKIVITIKDKQTKLLIS